MESDLAEIRNKKLENYLIEFKKFNGTYEEAKFILAKAFGKNERKIHKGPNLKFMIPHLSKMIDIIRRHGKDYVWNEEKIGSFDDFKKRWSMVKWDPEKIGSEDINNAVKLLQNPETTIEQFIEELMKKSE